MVRAKPVASNSCSSSAGVTRPLTGQGASRSKIGNARIGSSGMLDFSGASGRGEFAINNDAGSPQGAPALNESELAGVPIGGATTVCARIPHIGAAADARVTQPKDSTNAASVQRRTNQTFRV